MIGEVREAVDLAPWEGVAGKEVGGAVWDLPPGGGGGTRGTFSGGITVIVAGVAGVGLAGETGGTGPGGGGVWPLAD